MYEFILLIGLITILYGVLLITTVESTSQILKKKSIKRVQFLYGLLLLCLFASIIGYFPFNVDWVFPIIGLISFLILIVNLVYAVISMKEHIKRKMWFDFTDILFIFITQLFAFGLIIMYSVDLNKDLIIDSYIDSIALYYNIIALFIIFGFITTSLYVMTRIYLIQVTKKNIRRNKLMYYGFFSFGLFIGILYFTFFDFTKITPPYRLNSEKIVSIFELVLGSAIIPVILLLFSNKKIENLKFIVTKSNLVSKDFLNSLITEIDTNDNILHIMNWLKSNNVNYDYSRLKQFHYIHIKSIISK